MLKKDYLYNFILAAGIFAVMVMALYFALHSDPYSNVNEVYATATDASSSETTIEIGPDSGGTTTEGGTTENGTTEEGTTEGAFEAGTVVTVDGDGSESEAELDNAYASAATAGVNAEELANLTAEYSNTLKEKNELQANLNSIMDSQNDFITRLHTLDDMIIEYQDKIDELNTKITDATDLLYKLQSDIEVAQEKQDAQYELVKRHIKEEYENGKYSYLDALFNSVDYLDIINKSEYIQAIEAYDKGLLTSYTSEKQILADKRAVLMAVTSDMDILQEAYQNKQDSLEILSAEKEVQIKSYQSSIDSLKEDIEYLEKKEAEQSAQIAALESSGSVSFSISGGSSFTYNGEQFLWPMPSSTSISSYFGNRTAPTAGATTYHRGIDIPCSMGSPVIVVASGVVIYVGYLGSAGNAVVVDHGSGLSTCYYHLSSFAVSVGDTVTAGQTICYSGNTGVSTGPHLHFSVRENGEYVNPLKYYTMIEDREEVSNEEGN